MIHRVIFLLFLVTFLGCNKTVEKPKVNQQELEASISFLLDNWHQAASEANYQEYFNKMDSLAVFIGTDATENWSKNEFSKFSKPYFDNGKAWSFKAIDRNIYTNENQDFVWFDELLTTWMGTCRGSGVLQKKNNSWLIKHYVLSVAIPNEDVQNIIKLKQKNDSIFLAKLPQ